MLGAPRSNITTLWVSSQDPKEPPHVVTVSTRNVCRYLCDKRCLVVKQHSLCSHTVAAAEYNHHLEQFVYWLINNNKTQPNLTTAAYHETSQLGGKKGSSRYRPPAKKGDGPELAKADSLKDDFHPKCIIVFTYHNRCCFMDLVDTIGVCDLRASMVFFFQGHQVEEL